VDVAASLEAPHPSSSLFTWVEDLVRYPEWLDIVPRAAVVAPHPGDVGPAWSVDLRGRLGPFARAKRLRMVRTVHEPPRHARFERVEHDGRQHSSWVLDATVDGDGDQCTLTMRLHYGGRLWVPALDRLLADEIERSRPRLLHCLAR
jgi:ribosome-associated toxin RatA of RatAB toxin-antitoxin module